MGRGKQRAPQRASLPYSGMMQLQAGALTESATILLTIVPSCFLISGLMLRRFMLGRADRYGSPLLLGAMLMRASREL